jgi:hypothetical protein
MQGSCAYHHGVLAARHVAPIHRRDPPASLNPRPGGEPLHVHDGCVIGDDHAQAAPAPHWQDDVAFPAAS